ncbi:MAG: hypothetical protein EBR54_00260 [Flavobacteriia bacterium]|nr:hypothetical protein [Flavobacteriia bacterium]
MVWLPTPAVEGVKTPEAETPGPLHVPPGVAALNCSGASVMHIFCTGQMDASQQLVVIGAQAPAVNVCT